MGASVGPLAVQWMKTSLKKHELGGHEWAFDLETVRRIFDLYRPVDQLGVLYQLPSNFNVHFVQAATSELWTLNVVETVEDAVKSTGGLVYLHSLDSGHWVHIGAAKDLSDLIQKHSLFPCESAQ